MGSASLRFQALGGKGARAMAGLELTMRVPTLGGNEFLKFTDAIAERGEYGAFLVERATGDVGEKGAASRVGIGLFCVYEDRWTKKDKLAVEAVWFDPDCPDAQREAWSGLLAVAREQNLDALYLKLETISPPEPLEELLRAGGWDRFVVRREHHSVMQARSEGLWSAFTSTTRRQAAFADCVRVQEPVEISLSGVRSTGSALLFRGEGRVNEPPYASCPDLPALVAHIHQNGFAPRAAGTFGGSLVEQIRHQGYVSSPTVSLTSDPKVAAIYATARGTRGRAAVFAIDPSVLGEHAPVWDSFASMRAHHGAWLKMDFDSIVKLVRAFDVQEAGAILEGMYAGLRARKQQYEDTLGLQADARAYIDPSVVQHADSVLKDEEFGSLCTVLEHASPSQDRGFAREAFVATPYGAAFHVALPDLTRAQKEAAGDERRHPGWDTTPFGYIAKTCRDREFFSSGGIPAAAIKEARVVDAAGHLAETTPNPIPNPRYSGSL